MSKHIEISDEDWSLFLPLLEACSGVNTHTSDFSSSAFALRQDLAKYLELLLQANESINLTSIRDPAIGIWKHLYDSLLIASCEPMGNTLDWGTGGGTPGIPLALFRRRFGLGACRVDFLDSVRKKATIVEGFLRELDLPLSRVFVARGEELTKNQSFDTVVMRAVAPPERAVPWMQRSVKNYIFMTGPNQIDSWRGHVAAAAKRGFVLEKCSEFLLPCGQGTRFILKFCRK